MLENNQYDECNVKAWKRGQEPIAQSTLWTIWLMVCRCYIGGGCNDPGAPGAAGPPGTPGPPGNPGAPGPAGIAP